MKYLILLLIPTLSFAQPKGTNTIKVSGVTFKEAAITLMDAGFTLEKLDSNFQTLRTDWRDGKGSNKWMKLRLNLRIKDSAAILTGNWYNTITLNAFDKFTTIENEAMEIKNSYGNPKACFKEMDIYAKLFKKPVEYTIVK